MNAESVQSKNHNVVEIDKYAGGFDPMHQFEIHKINGLHVDLFGFDVSITNSTLTMIAITLGLVIMLSFLVKSLNIIPNKYQSLAEILYNFILSLVTKNIQSINTVHSSKFCSLICSLFIFIFFANAFGLLPYSFTITSHISVTLALALIVFTVSVVIGMYRNGFIGFFAALVPNGIPKVLAPLMLIIELFTYIARPLTLAVRLAVNMIAGHTMMKVVAEFVALMGAFGIIPIVFNSALIGFEFFVAGLQAYIFSILTCIYINDAFASH